MADGVPDLAPTGGLFGITSGAVFQPVGRGVVEVPLTLFGTI